MSHTAMTLADALRSEWTKLRTLRSTVWTVLVTIALGVGFGALLSLAGARNYAELAPADRPSFDPAATSLAGHIVAQLAIAVLGVLIVTSEPGAHVLAPWAGFGLLCATVALVLAVALHVFRTRDA
jgi:purine-cytosine permease-like protein